MSTLPRPPQQYEDFMRHVFEHGVQKSDRTGTRVSAKTGVPPRTSGSLRNTCDSAGMLPSTNLPQV